MKKINIAELLKDCPKGMELDCTLYDNCTFEGIEDIGYINILVKTPNGQIKLSKEGCIIHNCNSAKCVIFPKGKTTWEGFQRPSFKDGDIVTYKYENKLVSMILNKFVNFAEVHYHCALYDNAKGFVTNNYIVGELKYTHLATEEEKQKLFDVIKENGYKWNAETKTLEKLIEPKFQVGNRITNDKTFITIHYIDDEYYYEVGKNTTNRLSIRNQNEWRLVSDKFDITTLKPFKSKVLVRNYDSDYWKPATFGFAGKDKNAPFCVEGGNFFNKCIPYEGNEHLLHSRNDCDDYYKL